MWPLLLSSFALAGPDLRALLDAVADSAEARQQQAALAGSRADALAAGLRLAPTISASGGYTRNQYAVEVDIPTDTPGEFETAVITPIDQLDLTLQASVPLVDVGAWMRVGAARARVDAADATLDEVTLGVQREVVAAWYRAAAAEALHIAAAAAAEAARLDLSAAEARVAAGTGLAVDVARARASLARAEQQEAEATQARRDALRTLRSRTGLEVDDAPPLSAVTEAELPIEAWLASLDGLPSVTAARARADAARREAAAAWTALTPSVSATVGERITNAAGFGPSAAWSVGVQARWTLGAADGAAAWSRAAAVEQASAAAEQARRDAEDRVRAAWDRADALRARVLAAEAEARAQAEIVAELRARQTAGTATLGDVLDAAREQSAADAARIQATADLAAAQADLRLLAGRGEEVR
jgi:outer membrane protein TolC